MKNLKVTPMEEDVLIVVLKEIRHAVRIKGQVHLTIDPWHGGGCTVFASANPDGTSYEFPEHTKRKPKKARRR